MHWFESPELTLSFLIGCAVKATFLLTLAGVVAWAIRNSSAAMRHHAWALGIACSLGLPILTLILPSWHSATLGSAARLWGAAHAAGGSANFQKLPSTVIDAAVASPLAGQLITLTLLLWALGALFILTKLFMGLARLAWMSARSAPLAEEGWTHMVSSQCAQLGIARPVQILLSADPASMPLTWGFLRPRILLPAGAIEWPPDRRRTVLSHELAHIARHDWLAQICGELTRAMYWFHPLIWFAVAKLRSESERACDDSVLNTGVDPSHYANQLLELARTLQNAHRGWSTALAIARPSNLERRFIAMLNPNLNRGGISRRTGLLLKVAALCLLLPLAALRLPGQNLSGKFSGAIFDISDATVPNATIVMTNHKANTVDMTTSDAEGNFVFKTLPAGEYEMRVLKPGFATYLAPQVVLEPGRDLALNAKLEMGSLNESVDVQAEGSAKAAEAAEAEAKAKMAVLPGTADVEYRGRPYALKPQAEGSAKAAEALEAEPKPKTMRIRIGGNVEAAKIITKVQPIYPESAKAAGVQGSVLLHAIVSKDGRPLSLQVLNSQVNSDLARAAVEAVSQWRYQPTLLNGEPVEIDTTIQVKFTLLQ
ncbi:MAG TPA: M56 family metallopeptidase [Candidatus Acidoferrum sp.]|nr:M56 family metallopeptidase [Candidatus Acidoferrum sp.]